MNDDHVLKINTDLVLKNEKDFHGENVEIIRNGNIATDGNVLVNSYFFERNEMESLKKLKEIVRTTKWKTREAREMIESIIAIFDDLQKEFGNK